VLCCRGMHSGEGTKPTPQFETAEFQAQPGKDTCFVCHQPISSSYYRVNTKMACGACTERLRNSVPKDNHAAFVRAVAFGAVAAVVGLALYAVVGIATGLMIGYVSLAVGWIVGTAMMKGSGGLGGRRYQMAAVLFTYAAVSLAAIPMSIADAAKQKKQHAETQVQGQSTPDSANRQTPSESGNEAEPANEDNASGREHRSFVGALGYLALIGLASPFLELSASPFNGLIGLVILMVGIRIAWRLTRGHPPLIIDGPF
jgi:hypothetical protein